MGNAVDVAKRVNEARAVWAEVRELPAAVERLMREYSIGRRQAYLDLRRARRLRGPVPIPEATIAFTVKLSPRLCMLSLVRMRTLQATV